MKFSKFHKIKLNQAALDFVDVDNQQDLPVYVDPFAIEISDDPWSIDCAKSIRAFFQAVLDALRSGNMTLALKLAGNLSEPKETFLGVSSGIPEGKGVGTGQAKELLVAIRKSSAFKSGKLSDFSEMSLFVDGVGRDKISDLTTNIIRRQLVSYTKLQCDLFNVPLEQYASPPIWDAEKLLWRSEYVNLPKINDDFVMLVPKWIVRRQLSLDHNAIYKKEITDFLVAEELKAHSSLVHLVKGRPKVLKKDVREKHPKSKNLIALILGEHPELLQLYKKIVSDRGQPQTFEEDAASISAVCKSLIDELKATPPGAKDAERYHSLVQGALSLIFYPSLILPRKEWEINGGRKRIDIVFTNSAKDGFFHQRLVQRNTSATMMIVECKNYSDDINNPEIDQLLGRFDNNRGRLGFLCFRSVKSSEKLLDRLRDAAKVGNGYIIPVTDEELIGWLEHKAALREDEVQNSLHLLFSKLIS